MHDYLIRRAEPADAGAYALADAQMVAETYRYTMPPAFAEERLAEVERVARERALQFAAAVEAEAAGKSAERRTWIALRDKEIAGIVVTVSRPQQWERELGIEPVPGVPLQLNHLYVRSWAHGTGLGQALLDTAIEPDAAAYLWLVGGNARAERFYNRNGFRTEPKQYSCGPIWYDRPLFRMVRRGRG